MLYEWVNQIREDNIATTGNFHSHRQMFDHINLFSFGVHITEVQQ